VDCKNRCRGNEKKNTTYKIRGKKVAPGKTKGGVQKKRLGKGPSSQAGYYSEHREVALGSRGMGKGRSENQERNGQGGKGNGKAVKRGQGRPLRDGVQAPVKRGPKGDANGGPSPKGRVQ